MDTIKIMTQVSIIRGTHIDGFMKCIEDNKERKIERWKSAKQTLVLWLAFVQELVLGQVKGHVVARYSLKDSDKGEIVWLGTDLSVWNENEDEDMNWGLEMKLRVSIEEKVQDDEFEGLRWRWS